MVYAVLRIKDCHEEKYVLSKWNNAYDIWQVLKNGGLKNSYQKIWMMTMGNFDGQAVILKLDNLRDSVGVEDLRGFKVSLIEDEYEVIEIASEEGEIELMAKAKAIYDSCNEALTSSVTSNSQMNQLVKNKEYRDELLAKSPNVIIGVN